VNFYMERDEDIFNRVLFTNGSYLDELREYGNGEDLDVFATAFLSSSEYTEQFLQAILEKGTLLSGEPEGAEAIALLGHFAEQMPEEQAAMVWEGLNVTFVPESPEESAQNMYELIRDGNNFTEVAQHLRQAMSTDYAE